MTTFVPVPDGADVEIKLALFDRPCELTLHFINELPPTTPTRIGQLAVAVGRWFALGPLTLLSQELSLIGVVATDVSVAGGAFVVDHTWDRQGGVGTSSYSANVAAVISFQTGFHSGVTRQRNYIPGIPLGSLAGSRLPDPFLNNMKDKYDELVDAITLVHWSWVGFHRYAGSTPLSVGVASQITRSHWNRRTVGQRRKRLHNTFT